jgi:hypothetical protein
VAKRKTVAREAVARLDGKGLDETGFEPVLVPWRLPWRRR